MTAGKEKSLIGAARLEIMTVAHEAVSVISEGSFMGCCPLNNPTVSTLGSRVSLSLLSDNTIKLICFRLPDTSVLINSNLWCGRNWRARAYSEFLYLTLNL